MYLSRRLQHNVCGAQHARAGSEHDDGAEYDSGELDAKSPPEPRWANPEQVDTFATYLRAVIAIYASIFLNVGLWDILTESRSSRDGRSLAPPFPPSNTARATMIMLLGLVICIAMDAFYGNANLAGNLWPAWYHRALNKYKAVRMLRVAVAMFGQMLLWWYVCRCCNLSAIFYPFCSLCSVPAGCMT